MANRPIGFQFLANSIQRMKQVRCRRRAVVDAGQLKALKPIDGSNDPRFLGVYHQTPNRIAVRFVVTNSMRCLYEAGSESREPILHVVGFLQQPVVQIAAHGVMIRKP